MKRPITTFRGDGGQAIILLVVAMGIVMMGALGLAIDGGQMYAQWQMAQTAADAAAQAGILSIMRGTNATSAHPFGTGATPIASSVCTTTDGRTPCVYARYNGFGGTAADTVTLVFPSTVTGVTLSAVNVPAFAVTVQRTLQTGLIRFLGAAATSSITGKATAAIVGTVPSDCIYVLDPSAQNAFQVSNGATVVASGCALAVDSNNGDAASITGGASVTASAIDVTGGVAINNGGTTTPAPVTGVTAVTDPFASLPALTPASCVTHPSMYSPGSNTTLTPGTYCGGITVSNGATNVVFGAGDYIINGGGITFGGGATASGSNIMFYLTGTNATYASVTIANGVSVTFSGPTSGVYQGVLFFQNRSITSASNASFAGGATMTLTGSLYFPTTDVSFSNGSSAAGNVALIAKQVSFTGGTKIIYDPTGLKTGLFSDSVVLVQ